MWFERTRGCGVGGRGRGRGRAEAAVVPAAGGGGHGAQRGCGLRGANVPWPWSLPARRIILFPPSFSTTCRTAGRCIFLLPPPFSPATTCHPSLHSPAAPPPPCSWDELVGTESKQSAEDVDEVGGWVGAVHGVARFSL